MKHITTIRVTIDNDDDSPYMEFVFHADHNADTVITGNIRVTKEYGGIMDIVKSILKNSESPPNPPANEP